LKRIFEQIGSISDVAKRRSKQKGDLRVFAARINGGSMTVALHANPQKVQQSPADPASLVTLYSDLGTGTKVCLSNIGCIRWGESRFMFAPLVIMFLSGKRVNVG
jgi:hypothetical protein